MANGANSIRFGVFEVRADARELRKHGVRLKLEDQPFSVLVALLETPGAVVTRDELRAKIWPDGTFVDFDKSLTKAVNKIRTALDDSAATPRFVETLARRGYRFIAPVSTEAEPAAAIPPPERRLPRWPIAAGVTAVLVLLVSALVFSQLQGKRNTGSAPPIRSLAVLPIVNLTGDAAQEYFADGMTDDLISNLSRIRPLHVTSFTSMMRYKGAWKTVPEVGRELGVDGIIEGSVQRIGGRMRMNMKLLRAATDRQMWSESYEDDAANAAALQARVALEVAHQISAQLTAAADGGRASVNPRAYDSYLHGRYLWNLRGDSITQAAGFFEQAVREDPNFALAWSGLADSYTIGWSARSDAALAERYARKAVALAPDLAETHVSLGFALHCARRFAEAEVELKRGLELNPNYVPAHQLMAVHLVTMGRPLEALSESERALQLDPFSLPVNNMRGLILIALRRYDRAEEAFRTVMKIAPSSADQHYNMARVHWIQGKGEAALEAERKAAQLASGERAALLQRGVAAAQEALAQAGVRAACLRSVQAKEEAQRPSWQILLQYGLLEQREKVLEIVAREVGRTGYSTTHLLATAPELDFIRGDPRFRDLLRRIGLPEPET